MAKTFSGNITITVSVNHIDTNTETTVSERLNALRNAANIADFDNLFHGQFELSAGHTLSFDIGMLEDAFGKTIADNTLRFIFVENLSVEGSVQNEIELAAPFGTVLLRPGSPLCLYGLWDMGSGSIDVTAGSEDADFAIYLGTSNETA